MCDVPLQNAEYWQAASQRTLVSMASSSDDKTARSMRTSGKTQQKRLALDAFHDSTTTASCTASCGLWQHARVQP
jgi:hypothetical protein